MYICVHARFFFLQVFTVNNRLSAYAYYVFVHNLCCVCVSWPSSLHTMQVLGFGFSSARLPPHKIVLLAVHFQGSAPSSVATVVATHGHDHACTHTLNVF